jgi:hypothetical protein
MHHGHSSTHRAEAAPTPVELWANLEAKSPAMAADLIAEVKRPPRSFWKRSAQVSALLAIFAIVVLALLFPR